MTISARSALLAGAATITASAVMLAPSVQPLPPDVAVPAMDAVVQQVPSQQLVELLAAVQRLAVQPGPGAAAAPLAADQLAAPTAGLLAFPGLGNAIITAYNIIEPWVAYGVDLADYALGWIPFGWLIGDQINIFYDSFEPAVQSIFYNLGWWIGGSISFWQGLNDVILDGANAFIGLLNAEIRYGLGFLPPLPFGPPQIPYLPWFGLLTQTAPTSADALAPEAGVQNPAGQLLGLINGILDKPSGVNEDAGAASGGLLRSLIGNGFAGLGDFLGLGAQTGANPEESEKTSEVSTVPAVVKESLNGLRNVVGTEAEVEDGAAGPLADVNKTVRNLRSEIRNNLVKQDSTRGGNEVVRTQGEVRGPVGKAVTDAVECVARRQAEQGHRRTPRRRPRLPRAWVTPPARPSTVPGRRRRTLAVRRRIEPRLTPTSKR